MISNYSECGHQGLARETSVSISGVWYGHITAFAAIRQRQVKAQVGSPRWEQEQRLEKEGD